jgi:hypothetical protein
VRATRDRERRSQRADRFHRDPREERWLSLDALDQERYGFAMKLRVGWAVVVIAIVIGVVMWLRRGSEPRVAAAPGALAAASAAAPSQGSADPQPRPDGAATALRPPPPPTRVTRLASAAERRQVAAWIAAARAARAQRPAPAPGTTAEPRDLEHAPAKLKAALEEAIPILAECYKTGANHERRPAVQMTLVGDPDVGTLIDADQLAGPDGKPLDPELESCLRTTLGSMELPPLGGTEPLQIQYSFRFDDE